MARVNTTVAEEVRGLGASDLQACFSCGNCSAVCPLSEGEISFPRKMIRYSLLGLESKILSSPEPWLCYSCGECSSTCPREADPSGLMMALRRFIIRRYSIGRVADAFYAAFASGIAWVALSAVAIALIVVFHNPGMDRTKTDFLSFISLERIHVAGIAIVAFIALAFLANVWIMYRAMRRGAGRAALSVANLRKSSIPALREVAFQRRFGECEDDRFRRWAHLLVSWGFVGMFLATAIIGAVDFKWIPLPRWVSLVVGSVSGAAASVGIGYYIRLRFAGKSEYAKHSHQSDWVFLGLLALSILSGYVMVAFRFMHMPMAAYGAFSVHIVFVFNLLMSLPFTKFAHIVYRPIALWIAGLK
jgi:ferredoxin/nitrate reductase gamma subunit